MKTLERINRIVVDLLDVRPANITTPMSDLEADSLDMIEVVMAVEEEFDIKIPDADAMAWVTVGDVVAFVDEERAQNCCARL